MPSCQRNLILSWVLRGFATKWSTPALDSEKNGFANFGNKLMSNHDRPLND